MRRKSLSMLCGLIVMGMILLAGPFTVTSAKEPPANAKTLKSGGEQQMLAIARSMMGRPKLLMMDEPSLGLAPLMVRGLVPVIRDINKRGVGVLLVEQNVPLALLVATRAYALQVGRIIMEGDIDEFRGSEVVKKAYLGG